MNPVLFFLYYIVKEEYGAFLEWANRVTENSRCVRFSREEKRKTRSHTLTKNDGTATSSKSTQVDESEKWMNKKPISVRIIFINGTKKKPKSEQENVHHFFTSTHEKITKGAFSISLRSVSFMCFVFSSSVAGPSFHSLRIP